MTQKNKALIVVGDDIFEGNFFGDESATNTALFGEVVFNTSMTGYQEIITDPSYAGQIIVFTTAHVGNTGANEQDVESLQMHAEALIVSAYTEIPSNFRSTLSLDAFLKKKKRVGITDVDTRALTLVLRKKGVTPGFIIPASLKDKIPELRKELATKSHEEIDWIKKTSTKEPYTIKASAHGAKGDHKVTVYDYGVKGQLLTDLAKRGCDLTVVPADYPFEKVLSDKPDGVFLSNGPGDPSLADYAVKNVKGMLGKLPIFGVCMGHQILGLALGAKTYKLKFGHRGGNQPVRENDTGRVEISSHNHGYAVDPTTLPAHAKVTHVNLNDECCEGLSAESMRAFSVQYHPESSPGPHDSSYLFDQFVKMMK
jgi:carbamoyl-phosphate synthase small subunit